MGRSQTQTLLEAVLGSEHVYFQPPDNVSMQYPCIVYSRDGASKVYADNSSYRRVQRYQVTLISRMAEDPAVEKLANLPMCTETRSYAADGLNHDVFELYH